MTLMNELNYIELLINMLLASLGGLVKRISDMEKHPNITVKISYYLAGAFISMFAGIVIFLLCKNWMVPQYLTAGLTALAGYMGTPILDLLSKCATKTIKEKAGIDNDKKGE